MLVFTTSCSNDSNEFSDETVQTAQDNEARTMSLSAMGMFLPTRASRWTQFRTYRAKAISFTGRGAVVGSDVRGRNFRKWYTKRYYLKNARGKNNFTLHYGGRTFRLKYVNNAKILINGARYVALR